jgi:hypothetical protein
MGMMLQDPSSNILSFTYCLKLLVPPQQRGIGPHIASTLSLAHRKTPMHQKGPATQWDVIPKNNAQIDETDGPDELQHSLVCVPLVLHESD